MENISTSTEKKKVPAVIFLPPNKQMDQDQPWKVRARTLAYSCPEQQPLEAGDPWPGARGDHWGSFDSQLLRSPCVLTLMGDGGRELGSSNGDKSLKWHKKGFFRIIQGWKDPRGRVPEYSRNSEDIRMLKSHKHTGTSSLSACPKPGRPWISSLSPW